MVLDPWAIELKSNKRFKIWSLHLFKLKTKLYKVFKNIYKVDLERFFHFKQSKNKFKNNKIKFKCF